MSGRDFSQGEIGRGAPAERRKAWARLLIQRSPGAPMYGTPEWNALPDGPEKVASCVRAAECWATEGDDFAIRTAQELEVVALTNKRLDDAAWSERGEEHARTWKGGRPSSDPVLVGDVLREWAEWVGAE